MRKFQKGDIVIAVFTQPLPGKSCAPALTLKKEYEVQSVHFDQKGNEHLDVGLPMDVETIKSFETGESLPKDIRWCHPNRFVLKSNVDLQAAGI